jgi:hypothetical protein
MQASGRQSLVMGSEGMSILSYNYCHLEDNSAYNLMQEKIDNALKKNVPVAFAALRALLTSYLIVIFEMDCLMTPNESTYKYTHGPSS